MRKIIFIVGVILLLSLVAATEMQDIYVLGLKYDKGNISAENIVVTRGYFIPSVYESGAKYALEVISLKNKTLYSQPFDFELEMHIAPDPSWFDEKGNQIYIPRKNETTVTVDRATTELTFPYFEEARFIHIINANKLTLLSIPVNTNKPALDWEGHSFVSDNIPFFIVATIIAIVLIFLFIVFRKNKMEE